MDFWCQLQPHNLQNSWRIHLFYNRFGKISLSKLASIFDPILVPTCLHFPSKKPTKNALKLELDRHQFVDGFLRRFFIDFPSIWEANLGLCWPLRRAQDASKRPPRWLPRRSAWHFAILIDLWWILGGFLLDFGLILGRILIGFPSNFGQVSGRCFARFLIKLSTIFNLLARFLVDCSSAVAGTQLCCALDTIYKLFK